VVGAGSAGLGTANGLTEKKTRDTAGFFSSRRTGTNHKSAETLNDLRGTKSFVACPRARARAGRARAPRRVLTGKAPHRICAEERGVGGEAPSAVNAPRWATRRLHRDDELLGCPGLPHKRLGAVRRARWTTIISAQCYLFSFETASWLLWL